MLQTRLENEHLNLLSNSFQMNHSEDSYIITTRPDSSKLVDLHIYLIPKSIWRNIQHLAENDAVSDAVSAGFVRVQPETKLHHLRNSIKKACGIEAYFPQDFIFLRSVGRCFTKVKSNQENELKVKNYRPPETSAPEIYLLEGRHDDYTYLPSPSPIVSSVSYVFGNRFHLNNDVQSPLTYSHRYQRKPRRTDRSKLPKIKTHSSRSYHRLPRKNSRERNPKIDSDSDDSSASKVSITTHTTSRSLSKLKDEQERLRKRQAELEQMRRNAEEKKLQLKRDKTNQHPRRQEKIQSERKENEPRRHEKLLPEPRRQEKVLSEPRRQEKVLSEPRRQEKIPFEPRRQEKIPIERYRQEKIQSERRINESRPQEKISYEPRRQEKVQSVPVRREKVQSERREPAKIEIEQQRRASHDAIATKSQTTYRTFTERQAFRERQINLIKNDSRNSSANSNTIIEKSIENEKKIDINDDELSDGEILSRSSSIGSTSEDEVHISRAETRILIKEHRHSIQSNSSSLLSSMKSEGKLSSKSQKIDEKICSSRKSDIENNRTATVTKIRPPEDELVQISTPDINDNEKTYELERRAGEVQRRQQAREEKQNLKEIKERQRRELELSRDDPKSLRIRLHDARTRRIDLEKARDDSVHQLKSLHHRLTSRRQEARDLWKKKYYQEKKRTGPIELQSTQSTAELERLHKKTEQTIETEYKHAIEMGYTKEAELEIFITIDTHGA
ncbi:hypothetical protein I4U23_003026 [Adineta vaga]|nr:hypothetical protein I4U23_003026 [Adineta vaga]